MQNVLTEIANYLLAQSWQIAVLFVVVLTACWALRKSSAHWRYLLWLVVLAKCLVPPLLNLPLAVLPASPTPQPKSISVAKVLPLPTTATEAPAAVPVGIASGQTFEPTTTPSPPAAAPLKPAIWPKLTIPQWLTLAWSATVAAFVLFCLLKAWRTQARLTRTRQPANGQLANDVAKLADQLGLANAPKTWLIDRISQPFVWGLLRGSIYLPKDFAQMCDPQHRRSILMHELAHVSRWDAAVNFCQVAAQALFFFHPLVWWANKKIRQEREKCCDETAIASLSTKPRQYGTAIVDILVNEYESTHPVPSLAVAGPVKNIEERIKTMMSPNKKFYKHPTWLAIITIAILAAITIPTALTLTARAEPKPTPEPKPVATDPKFTATLPNGPTVELVGVTDRQNKNWWRPDGILLKSDLYQLSSKSYPNKKSQARGLATRIFGKDAEGVGLTWQIPKSTSNSSSSTIKKSGKELKGIHSLAFTCPKNLSQIDIRLGLAYGAWQTRHNNHADASGISTEGGEEGSVIWHRPNEKDDKTILVVAHSYSELNRRVVAIGKDNQLYTASSAGASVAGKLATIEVTFSIPLRKIREFQFQTRPYQWTEFRNVSLQPSKKTDVQVEVKPEQVSDVVGIQDNTLGENTSAEAAYIIQKVLDQYAAIKTYSAIGELLTDVDKPPEAMGAIPGMTANMLQQMEEQQLKSIFTIKMARPNLYCIEWNENIDTDLSKPGNVWSVGDGSYGLIHGKEKSFEKPLRALIATANNMGKVQSSLFFDTSLNTLRKLRNLSQQEDEQLEGVDCYVISGSRHRATYTYWVSKKDFLIRRYKYVSGGDGMPTKRPELTEEAIKEA